MSLEGLEEWTEVKLAFFTPSPPLHRQRLGEWVSKGIEMVNVWRARGGPPHSVESTAPVADRCDGAAEELENGTTGFLSIGGSAQRWSLE